MKKDVYDPLFKHTDFMIAFLSGRRFYEIRVKYKGGIEHRYLETAFEDLKYYFNQRQSQLLVVIAKEALYDERVPIYMIGTIDDSSVFSMEKYLRKFGLTPIRKGGRIRRVQRRV